MGLFFIIGVKFTRKSPQNAFNVGYRFQFWKVSERCKTMDPFPHTGIYLQKMELQWMMSFSSQTIRIPLNHNFFFFFACHMNNIKLSFKENNQFTLFFFHLLTHCSDLSGDLGHHRLKKWTSSWMNVVSSLRTYTDTSACPQCTYKTKHLASNNCDLFCYSLYITFIHYKYRSAV